MGQQPAIPPLAADPDHQVVLFPTRSTAAVSDPLATRRAGRPAATRQERVRAHVIREVVVLEVSGRLSEAVEELDRAIQLALAEAPRGVVCDLSVIPGGGADPVAVEVLATAGRHVRDWSGVPVAVACPDPRVREALRAHPLGGHLIATPSLFSAISAVVSTPALSVNRLHLAPHPTAPRASREFVTRTLLDWRLRRVIPFASLVVSELVASSSMNAGTDMDLCVVWDLGALRLTVRDHGPGLPDQPDSVLDLHGRRLTVVAGLSRAFGVLPTANGGKVVWAVLDAPRPQPSNSPDRSAVRSAAPVRNAGHPLVR
ncbi:MAG: hypothetical protein QOE58_1312 [Actinomycetota bacterium]|nr:hypothetical protein [Actinomycetota bacterium]